MNMYLDLDLVRKTSCAVALDGFWCHFGQRSQTSVRGMRSGGSVHMAVRQHGWFLVVSPSLRFRIALGGKLSIRFGLSNDSASKTSCVRVAR